MMQCVACNKSFLFTSRLKALKYQKKKTTIIMEQKKFPNVLEVKETNSFLYEIEA
jgi:hypothetical protein